MSPLARQCARLALLLTVLRAVGRCGASQPQPSVGVSITPDELLRLIERAITSEIQPLVSKLASRIDALDSRLIGVDSRLNTLDSRLLALDTTQDRLDTRLGGLTSRNDQIQDRLDTGLDELTSRVDELTAQPNTRDSCQDGLSSRLDNLSSHLEGLSSRLDTQQSRLDELANRTDGRQAESDVDRADPLTQTPLPRLAGHCSHEIALPRDCSDLPVGARSGIHLIQPGLDHSQPPVPAFCDLDKDGGGWTVIQRRADIEPRQEFHLGWAAYQEGFGELDAEFWFGLGNLWKMTAPRDRRYELRVNLADFDGGRRHAIYQQFRVASEADGYRLSVANYTGDAGDSFSYHNGQKFTTKDKDQDIYSTNCAQKFKGAGWYKSCYRNNLNGQYLSGPTTSNNGVNWNAWRGDKYSLKEVEVKIRPLKSL